MDQATKSAMHFLPRRGKAFRHFPVEGLERQLCWPQALPLLRLSVEGIHVAGANVTTLFENGFGGELLLAQSLRDSQTEVVAGCPMALSAERLHGRLKQHLLSRTRRKRGPNQNSETANAEFIACGGANARLE